MTTKVTGSILANTAVTAGTYGGASTMPIVTVDAQGRITAASNATPSIATSQLTGTISSAQVATGAIGITQLANPLSSVVLANTTISNIYETTNVWAVGANSTINFDVLNQAIIYSNVSATGTWTLNLRGNSTTTLNSVMPVGGSATVAFFATQGTTAYYSTTLNIDGTSQTIKWLGGTAPTSGDVSSVDCYTYSIIKTASATFTVFGSQSQFK